MELGWSELLCHDYRKRKVSPVSGAISRIRISCSVTLMLACNAPVDASEVTLQHQRLWAQYAKELENSDAPRVFAVAVLLTRNTI